MIKEAKAFLHFTTNMEVLFVAVVGLLLICLVNWKYGKRRLPPGPWGLPIVGYIPFLSSKPYLTFGELAKKYGNIFSIRLGNRTVVVLNDFESTKSAFVKDAFIGRPPDIPFQFSKENIATEAFLGLPWKEQRRYCLQSLRDLGLGKSTMEERIQEEIEALLPHFEKNAGKPFSVRELLSPSMSNNIASLMFGKRFKLDDPIRQMLSRAVSTFGMAAGQVGWLVFFPWLKDVFQFLGIGEPDKLLKSNEEIKEYTRKEIDEHEKTFNPDNLRDFIDGYLLEIRKRNDPTFCKAILADVVTGFFAAGSDTVRQGVEWLLLTVASNPKHQRRIQEEINEVLGPNRKPNWLDQKNMPFTEAYIMETMRWRTIIPINLLRYTLQDTELKGHFIPKHTYVISNHWAIHHDLDYWGTDADEFRPERFFDEEKKAVKKWDHYIPFSIGKRSCPGEPLAKVEIFLYFVSVLQKFDVSIPTGAVADFEGELGVSLQMKDQDIVLTKRS